MTLNKKIDSLSLYSNFQNDIDQKYIKARV